MTWLRKHSAQVAAYSGLALCIVFFTILTPIFGESIWSAAKIRTLMQNVIVLALMSVGATFVYSLGSMDISIGRQVGLYATLTVIIGNTTGSLLWGILLSLVISVVISAINGAAGEVLNIHPVISSLVFQMVISGVSSVMNNSLGSRNVALSLLVALFYVYARVPIIITTIGFALLYEAITCLVFSGTGISIISNMTLRRFATYPAAVWPLIGVIALYAICSCLTTSGRQATLLANNQQSAVNIGIRENRNVIVSYVFSGLIFGLATVIRIAKAKHDAACSSMMTVGQLFSNILPVFIGLMLARFCGDTIGIIMGSVTLCLLSYALNAVFANTLGTAISNICMGTFILVINVVNAQGRAMLRAIGKVLKKGVSRT